MTRIHHRCAKCGVIPAHQVRYPSDGKAAGLGLGLTVGLPTKNVWGLLGMAILGTLIGHAIDETVTPNCPICGLVLQVIAAEFTG